MEPINHTFPLPEVELHKLDEVKEVVQHALPEGTERGSAARWFGPGAFAASFLAGVLGFLLWKKYWA